VPGQCRGPVFASGLEGYRPRYRGSEQVSKSGRIIACTGPFFGPVQAFCPFFARTGPVDGPLSTLEGIIGSYLRANNLAAAPRGLMKGLRPLKLPLSLRSEVPSIPCLGSAEARFSRPGRRDIDTLPWFGTGLYISDCKSPYYKTNSAEPPF